MYSNNYYDTTEVSSAKAFYAKVFFYIGLGLLVTFAVAFGLGALFTKLIGVGSTDILSNKEIAYAGVYLGILISASIMQIVAMIWIMIAFRRGKAAMVPFIIYAVVMGIFISAFTMFLPFWMIAAAFGLTSLVFGVMGLSAYLLGDKAKWFGIVGIGLLFGAIIVSLFVWLTYLISGGNVETTRISAILSIVVLFAMLLITIFDFYRMNKIAQSGAASKNLALYCAFNLYVDFIYIFIRILILLANSKR